jgi:hypothetical protein
MKDGKQGEGGKGEGGKREAEVPRNWAAIAVGAPGCLLALVSAVALTLAALGRYPMWPHEEINLAEAAGVREEAEVVRLIELGQDPNARYPVRAGLVFDRIARLTPLEAAVLNDDPAIAAQLFARGVALEGSSWVALRCFAPGLRVVPVLDAHRPAGATLDCDQVRTPWDL